MVPPPHTFLLSSHSHQPAPPYSLSASRGKRQEARGRQKFLPGSFVHCLAQEQQQINSGNDIRGKIRRNMSRILLLLACFISSTVETAADNLTGVVYAACSQSKYALGSPYQQNVDALLSSLANAASFSAYANVTSASAAAAYPSYGLFQCRGDLPPSDCASCVRSALPQLSSSCPFAADAVTQLFGCFLRYGNDSFIGKPDTTLLYNKCGPPAGGGYNNNQIAARDAALAELTSSAGFGGYRLGAAGYVQAVAQCVGDQSASQCDECVASAVSQLRAECGFAISGDVYLGKCYARFWSNSDGGYNYPPDNYHGDTAGKTAAIIIGLIAGVALIIIFLSFLRKAGSGKD